MVLPITEVSTLLVTENQQRLPAFCRVPFPDAAVVANAANKAHVIRLAERLGVPIPRSAIVKSADEGICRAGEHPYPIVVKPARSRVRVGSGMDLDGCPLRSRRHRSGADPAQSSR